jgi:nlpC/P60 family protein
LDGWYKIRSGPITGYVKSDYILTGQAAKDAALEEAELMAVVTADALYARAEPNTNSKIFTTISNSEKYPIVSQSDGWVEIELEDNNNAFLSTEFVDVRYALNEAIKFTPAEDAANAIMARRNEIVNYAMQFLGNPYVWGGTSLTNGCDCSGFTMQILGKYGVGLPHYSVSQSQMGTKIDASQMKPGDLIFYSNRRGVINHVSMYIGNGQVIHAASRKSGIKISAWNYRNPTTIRNVIGD